MEPILISKIAQTPQAVKFPKASQEQIDQLKKVVQSKGYFNKSNIGTVANSHRVTPDVSSPEETPRPLGSDTLDQVVASHAPNIRHNKTKPDLYDEEASSGVNYVSSMGVCDSPPMQFDNPVMLASICEPHKPLHHWQFETLMMLAGYLTPGNYVDKSLITRESPFRLAMPAANSSGKDNFVIALFAVWFALTGQENYVVGTSSSFEQVKYQTEPHIRRFADIINATFGKYFYSTQFLHVIKKWNSKIKLFATNDAGRAEGFHPYGKGAMALIMNEAKSIDEDIFSAIERCEGFSYWLEISSPGGSAGHFFESVKRAINYPNPVQLGKYYYRKITAFDCPHIPKSYIDDKFERLGEDSPLYRSSILAEFSDVESDNIIKLSWVDACLAEAIAFIGNDIGIGLDLAAGGDENACWVRKGNRIIHKFFFTQKDTTITADAIDRELAPWKDGEYILNADNGGIGQGIIDALVKKGWHVTRRNNQSPAFNKREFTNLGAEMWYYTKRLIERKAIHLPASVPKLIEQLTTRACLGLNSTQGRVALEAKPEARAKGRPSPDRADAFVLCFYSYRPDKAAYDPKAQPDAHKLTTPVEFELMLRAKRHRGFLGSLGKSSSSKLLGRYTTLTGTI